MTHFLQNSSVKTVFEVFRYKFSLSSNCFFYPLGLTFFFLSLSLCSLTLPIFLSRYISNSHCISLSHVLSLTVSRSLSLCLSFFLLSPSLSLSLSLFLPLSLSLSQPLSFPTSLTIYLFILLYSPSLSFSLSPLFLSNSPPFHFSLLSLFVYCLLRRILFDFIL